MSDLLVVVDDIAQVVATGVVRLADAHGVVGEVDIAVVAEELRHGCGRAAWICRVVCSMIMRLSYSAGRESEGVGEGAVEVVSVKMCCLQDRGSSRSPSSFPKFEARAFSCLMLASLPWTPKASPVSCESTH